ncbi:MAG: gamma carbonic anhydrase family protein [Candidatus Ranarchaeia archaeon]
MLKIPIMAFGKKIPKIDKTAYVSPDAFIMGDVTIGDHVSVWPGSIIRADFEKIQIGRYSCIQDGVFLHARKKEKPLLIGAQSLIGGNSVLNSCYIGDSTFIGESVVIFDGATIADNCMITPGSPILENQVVSPRSVLSGVPAVRIREVTKEEISKHEDRIEVISQVFTRLIKYLPSEK